MTTAHLLHLVPLLALLAWAAVEDVGVRRIRNWLTVSLMLTGLAHNAGTAAGLGWATLGLLAGFGLTVGPFALGAWGGGDVKLMAGIGAWVGPAGVLAVFLLEAVIGMAIVVAQAAAAGRLRLLGRNSAVIAMNLTHIGHVGADHVRQTGQDCRTVDRPLAYAVPTCVATVLLMAAGLI